jgi:5-methylcytosine-specific restriction endonuclease McrA
VANLTIQARLFFAGLWCVADREGRFVWRWKRLKAQIFPYDDFDVPGILEELERAGFVRSYSIDAQVFGVIDSWTRNQIPARDEPPSEIPAPDGSLTAYSRPPNQTIRARIYQRDNYRCAYCDRNLATESRARVLDHVIPYSKGGTNNEKNLVTACKTCNATKSDRTPTEAGFTWPDGLGETYQTGPYVNPPLTVVPSTTDPDVLLGNRNGNGELGLGNGDLAPAALAFRASDLMELWNNTTKPPIPRCRELTEDRKRKIRARIAKRPSISEWREAFEFIEATPFYRGENDRGWTADFDYVIKNDTVIAKVLERARAKQAAPAGKDYSWVCHHEPKCSARNEHYVKTQIEQGRAS